MNISEELLRIRFEYPIYKNIFNIIDRIPIEIIDLQMSYLEHKDNFVMINLYSVKNTCCPFSVYLGINSNEKVVLFSYDKSNPILDKYMKNESELSVTEDIILDHLSSTVKENIVLINNKIVKTVYTYYLNIDNEQKQESFKSIGRMFVFPWEKRKFIENKYDPWIKL